MAKVTFCVDSGANIHSCKKQVFDTVKDLGLEEGEWEGMNENDRYEMVEEWANEYIEIYYKEE